MSTHLSVAVSAHDHVQGVATAPVTLVEYGDFQCPYCGRAYPIVKAVQRQLGEQLRFVFRNFPLREAHVHAELAAEAAEAAGAQGQFWQMHDLLFENQADLAGPSVLSYASRLPLDVERWANDLSSRAFASRVQQDFAGGRASGVGGTPTFFINGRRHDGSFDLESLLSAVEAALPPAAAGH